MNRTITHRVTICTSCPHRGGICQPGYALIERLRAAISAAGDAIDEDFEITGMARMAGCTTPCTVAYHATRHASYLFGDIDPKDDIGDLVEFAHQYAALGDGWCDSVDWASQLQSPALSRIPASIIALEDTTERAS